ncbi:MAG: hypothetical protein H0T18_02935 [Chloroflexia bacterium]|nr:hypothetical protein [Chloroflexia bacterium]
MARANVAAAGFAVAGGVPADPAGVVHIAPGPDHCGRTLLVSVEPLNRSPRGFELATATLQVIRSTFAATPGAASDALIIAFAAANTMLLAENRPLATGRWERRICVGATGVVLTGREIVVAQSAPSQAILVQDDQIYAFPDIQSWRGDYVPDAPVAESHPLGFAEESMPRLYQSEAAPGDIILLCATSVGWALARDDGAVIALHSGTLLTGDLEGSIDRLERLLVHHDVCDAYAVVADVSRLPQPSRVRLALPRAAASETTLPPDHQRPPMFEGLRDWAVDLAELLSAHRAPAPISHTRQRELAAPGALSVRRYRESAGLPAEWRANLPRGSGVHLPVRLLAVSLILFVALGGTGFAVGHQRDREARAEASLLTADASLKSARENPGSAMSSVAEAERAVAVAREAGATGDTLLRREQELARVRDDVWGIRRLHNVERIGALPQGADSGPVRLAMSGQSLFLAAGNLYELDPDQKRLIALLSRGDTVADNFAGDLRHVSIDDGNVIASDGTATYARDTAGLWQRQSLAVEDVGGLRPDAPVIVWGDAAYGLAWNGDVVRFDGSAGGPLATIWAAIDESPDLELAGDFAIDGRIHVLLDDGRTLTFSRGDLIGSMTPFVVPALNSTAFLATAPFANALYIVDREGTIGANTGRLVRVDAAGDTIQYLTPASAAGDLSGDAVARALAKADDLVVDELTGLVYWVSGGEIWRASLPSI